ncbi:hypothetical protein L596_030613 [Steinernema carpocapsae]|uniref:Uncharacterized protein n=1 Tax=Steinernema carpocapsae TaxID=34508 RepID=A0A4U5LPX3_STECR|nr:hypothetical protein L596_030613 [Steinernema carpocapsae]
MGGSQSSSSKVPDIKKCEVSQQNAADEPKKLKACCACPETKKAEEVGYEGWLGYVKTCLFRSKFDVWEVALKRNRILCGQAVTGRGRQSCLRSPETRRK